MTEQKYTLVDLTGDGHGHHIAGTPDVFSHGWKLLKGGGSSSKHTPVSASGPGKHLPVHEDLKVRAEHVVSLTDKKGRFDADPTTLRHFRKVTEEKRLELFSQAGIKGKYEGHSIEELHAMWTDTESHNTPEEKDELRHEIDVRMKQLSVYAASWDQSLTDTAREHRRENGLAKWESQLRKTPGGKTLLSLRDRLLTDKVLDKSDKIKEWLHENGKEYAKDIAVVLAIGALLHPLGLAVGGLVAHQAGAEVVSHLMENIFVHAGISLSLTPVVLKVLNPIFHPLTREARIEKGKRVVRARELKTQRRVAAKALRKAKKVTA